MRVYALAVLPPLATAAFAQEPPESQPADGATPILAAAAEDELHALSPAGRQAAGRGLKWLLKAQNEDGSWGEDFRTPADAACTSIAGLALLASGETARDGPHRDAVRKAAAWVAARALSRRTTIQTPDSSISRYLGRWIHDYLACAFLAECAGMQAKSKEDEDVTAALRKLARRIEELQDENGSWNDGVEPLTTTAIAYMALRSAHAAGVTMEKASLPKTVEYVESRIDTKNRTVLDPAHGLSPRFTGTSGALRVILGLGREKTPQARTAIEILRKLPFGRDYGDLVSGEDYFGGVLGAQAMIHDEDGAWRDVFRKIQKVLVAAQNSDGSWTGHHCIGARTFCTACAVLTLETPLRLLPMIEL